MFENCWSRRIQLFHLQQGNFKHYKRFKNLIKGKKIFIESQFLFTLTLKNRSYSGTAISLTGWKADMKAVIWIFSLAPEVRRYSIFASLSKMLINTSEGNSTVRILQINYSAMYKVNKNSMCNIHKQYSLRCMYLCTSVIISCKASPLMVFSSFISKYILRSSTKNICI